MKARLVLLFYDYALDSRLYYAELWELYISPSPTMAC